MMPATLPDLAVSIKTPELDSSIQLITDEGSLVIRIGVNGAYSSEILASQSETQERLLDLMKCLRPVLNDVVENHR